MTRCSCVVLLFLLLSWATFHETVAVDLIGDDVQSPTDFDRRRTEDGLSESGREIDDPSDPALILDKVSFAQSFLHRVCSLSHFLI